MPVDKPGQERERRPAKYNTAERAAIVSYLGLDGPEIPNVEPARGSRQRGAELFLAECASCHQWAGPRPAPGHAHPDRRGGQDRPGQHARLQPAGTSGTWARLPKG